MTDGRTDSQTVTFGSHPNTAWGRGENNVAVAHPYHAKKSCSKLGLIPPSCLTGNSETDGQTDKRTGGGVFNIAKAWG